MYGYFNENYFFKMLIKNENLVAYPLFFFYQKIIPTDRSLTHSLPNTIRSTSPQTYPHNPTMLN